jgi:hypothetical protein
MTSSWWWWFWVGSLGMLLAIPMAYGWGYRGWGPPYPRYYQRSQHLRAEAAGGGVKFDHQAWGLGGDFIWILFCVAMVSLAVSIWPYRTH